MGIIITTLSIILLITLLGIIDYCHNEEVKHGEGIILICIIIYIFIGMFLSHYFFA